MTSRAAKRRVTLPDMQIRHVPGSIVLGFIFPEKSLVRNIRFSNTFLSQMKLRPVYVRYLHVLRPLFSETFCHDLYSESQSHVDWLSLDFSCRVCEKNLVLRSLTKKKIQDSHLLL